MDQLVQLFLPHAPSTKKPFDEICLRSVLLNRPSISEELKVAEEAIALVAIQQLVASGSTGVA